MKQVNLLLKSLCLGLCLLLGTSVKAENPQTNKHNRPRIVVGMVVDQMCWDYLYRYYDQFEEGGFRRLMKEGFNCENTRIEYIPSVTAIGHSTVYTGSVPSLHGIAGNHFFENGKGMYCTEDKTVQAIGVAPCKAGQMSPRNMKTTTIGDELRLATNFKNKVIGIALKDRGAILPAGHSANAAYWFEDKSGKFITSSYYMNALPQWLVDFNKQELAKKYLKQKWSLLKDESSYSASSEDANEFEGSFIKGKQATLPLDLAKLSKKFSYGLIRSTPFGNQLTLDLAKATIKGEEMGKGSETDFLAISLSSTDYIGHRYGTFAQETEDTYLRLDRDLSKFFAFLDEEFGKEGYVFFMTADHAAAHNVTFMEAHKLKGRAWKRKAVLEQLQKLCQQVAQTEEKLILDIANYQVFFDENKIDELHIDRAKLYKAVCSFLEKQEGVNYAVVAKEVQLTALPQEIRMRIINGYNHQRSGAIFIVLDTGWYAYNGEGKAQGTSHAVWAPYDTHIPLIFMGRNIKAQKLYREVYMTDIAATLAFMLKTQLPSGCIGKPITEILE